MSSWNIACDMLKSVLDDEDEVEKADGLTEKQQARLGVTSQHGAKPLKGQTLKKVEGAKGQGLVHNRPGKMTITSAPPVSTASKPSSRQRYLSSPHRSPTR